MEKYVYFTLGRMFQFDQQLNQELEELDRKDQEIIELFRNTQWVNEEEKKQMMVSARKAQCRIEMRKDIMQELEKEKIAKMIDVGTGVGLSLQKDYS